LLEEHAEVGVARVSRRVERERLDELRRTLA
jgi:hypothetical protein